MMTRRRANKASARRYPDLHSTRREEQRDPNLFVLTAQLAFCALLVLLSYVTVDANPPFLAELTRQYQQLITAQEVEIPTNVTLPAIPYEYGQLRDAAADAAGKMISGLLAKRPQQEETESMQPGAELEGMGGWMGVPEETGTRQPPESCADEPILVSARVDPPAGGKVTSAFGYRTHPITDSDDFHRGVDIAAAQGTAIRAALPGRVAEIGSSQIYGNFITLDHGDGLTTTYCHCELIIAPQDANLRQGELVATVGSTGISTGPHVHFEISKDGTYYDPAWVLDGMRADGI
ncbi:MULTISPECIES: M23 family metallopeptidase [Anaerotruncus]|jgi:murein DD-endopeptidase MepM/ murein hydrolase activator NlpD|uniref:M23 family metallopeptidase n=1 Tax=Anaerotruncus TaxID=244127 RepID=UPI000835CC2A|nr:MULTISPECIES: M23 family metallopeptidase [Anaerotruncus]RGX55722.1 M23 family peptidase [Anaerotruncus sp. AF02-27]